MRQLGVLLLLSACGEPAPELLDASDATTDTPSSGLGIFVVWEASPELPGSVTKDLVVADVTFQLRNLELLADSGSAVRSKYLLAWSAQTEPMQETFPDAPAGVYSQVSLDLGGNLANYAYQIHGTWKDDRSDEHLFRIEDRSPLNISFDCNKLLIPAGATEVAVRMDLRDALDNIDFDRLDERGGTLVLDNGSPQLGGFRNRLQRAFVVE